MGYKHEHTVHTDQKLTSFIEAVTEQKQQRITAKS